MVVDRCEAALCKCDRVIFKKTSECYFSRICGNKKQIFLTESHDISSHFCGNQKLSELIAAVPDNARFSTRCAMAHFSNIPEAALYSALRRICTELIFDGNGLQPFTEKHRPKM